MRLDINGVLKTHFVRALIDQTVGDNFDLIARPASLIVKGKTEGARDIQRLIFLPPKGFTADRYELLSSHDEAERATIEIKGGVKSDKRGFSKVKDCLLVVAFSKSSMSAELEKPYRVFDANKKNEEGLNTEYHSAGEPPFSVVKADGYGFYHNLINLSDDWLVLKLNKRLRPQRPVHLESHLSTLSDDDAQIMTSLYQAIVKHGDGVFKEAKDLVEKVLRVNPDHALPALGEMLFVYDNGKHEACSAFAIILKVGRSYPEETLSYLEKAIVEEAIPAFYAEQLIEKLKKLPGKDMSSNADFRMA